MVINRCVKVEIHDFWVPTIGTYLLIEILLEYIGFVYLQFFFFFFFFVDFSSGDHLELL